jgi:hypothetical protein
VKGNVSRPDPWPVVFLSGGFLASATAVFALVSVLGTGLLGSWRAHPAAWLATAVLISLLLLADAELFGLRTPMWRRQTPKWFMYRFGNRRSALFWGLDAGLVATTFRVTSLSWAALSMTLFGHTPWWTGVVYAMGFVVPQLIFDLAVPRRHAPDGMPDPEPTWVLAMLMRARLLISRGGRTLLGVAALWSAATGIAGL